MSEAGQQSTLLFVDDEPNILSSLRRLFRANGYAVLTAGSGAEGLDVLARERVDLIISDMRMPEMDGAKFLEQARARWPQVARILLTGYADVASTIAAINRGEIYRYIAKPWDDDEILLTVREALEHRRLKSENERLLALSQRQNEELKDLNAGLEQKVAARTAELKQALAFIEQAHVDLKKGFLTSVRMFSTLIEMRGGKQLAGHSRRVADHGRGVAQRLGLDEATTQNVMLAGLLHDVGKIGLPDELLVKPFNSLAAEARAQVMKHVLVGQNVMLAIDQLKDAALLVRHHHECFDGSGYPDGLAGLAIPIGSRILCVVNDYDALQLGTLAQSPLKADAAQAFIVENRGKRYDPAVVDAFIGVLAAKGPAGPVELPLRPHQLKPGMKVARDLMHREGYLLLARDHVLDAIIIKQLGDMEEADGQSLLLYIRQEAK